jgi:hypothetical protein
MATKKTTKKKTTKSDRMPGFFESGPVEITHRPKGYYEVMKEMGQGKKKKK